MSSVVANPLKAALRKQIKGVLLTLSHDDKKQQSDAITKKVHTYGRERFNSLRRLSYDVYFLSLSLQMSHDMFLFVIDIGFGCIQAIDTSKRIFELKP